MLFKSQLVTQVSGSIGGITGSHNSGGIYFRARAIPTDPNTNQQQAVRTLMQQLSNLWVNTLTQAQRDAWLVYALLVPLTGPLGDLRTVSALNQYVRSNLPRLQQGMGRRDDAPTIFDTGDFQATVDAIDATADEVDVGFDPGQAWIDEDNAACLVYCSRPQNASIGYFRGPYRLAGAVNGSSTVPPTSPTSIALPFPVVAGQVVFSKLAVTRDDGRLASPFRIGVTAA